MYDQVFGNLRKATEAAIQAQQEMFRTWTNYWAGKPDQVQAVQQKWVDTFGDLIKKQQDALEAQYKSGLKMIEDAFTLPTAKDPEALRRKLIEDWEKDFESHQRIAEEKMQAFHAALAKWTERAAVKPMTPWDWWLTGG